jgi:hypothetical protein
MHVKIQGGIVMSVINVTDANSLFMQERDKSARQAKKTVKSDQREAMELFGKVLQDCEKASERMMDKHHETVAKSARELAEYHKRKAVFDRMKASADEQRMINEQIVLNRINQHALLKDMRADDIAERENIKKTTQ